MKNGRQIPKSRPPHRRGTSPSLGFRSASHTAGDLAQEYTFRESPAAESIVGEDNSQPRQRSAEDKKISAGLVHLAASKSKKNNTGKNSPSTAKG